MRCNNDDFINFVNSETESGLLNKSDESDAEGNKLHKAIDSTKLAKLNIIAKQKFIRLNQH